MPASSSSAPPRKNRHSWWLRYGWVTTAAAVAVAVGAWFVWRALPHKPPQELLPGYLPSLATVQQEYARFHGKLLKDNDVEQQFDLATRNTLNRDYVGAVDLLEAAAKQAAVPIIFNNMGVLYAALNDRSRAINAFREALARDIDYQPVRANLRRLKGFTSNDADPVTREIEPNDTNLLANLIAFGKPVDAEIGAGVNDVDCFKVTSPSPPRDILQIRIDNASPSLALSFRIYDSERRMTNLTRQSRQPGASLTQTMAPPPNTTFYVDVLSLGNTSGQYAVSVQPMRAYDAYEPNDEIFNARRIQTGQTIEANIMDAQDTDFYSFISPRTGTLQIDIHNRSATLIPALTTFTPDMRNSGFGPDVRTPGASLHHTMKVEENQTYYIQVWSQANSFGDYVLTIE